MPTTDLPPKTQLPVEHTPQWIREDFAYPLTDPPDPRWIRHEVMPGERLNGIAERYGVTRKNMIKWNRLHRKRPRLRAGQRLKVRAERFGPPRIHARYRVRRRDTWRTIAAAFGLTRAQLKRANRRGVMSPGTFLHVWADSAIPNYGNATATLPDLDFEVPEGGVSIGRPYRGRLQNGIQLPDSDLYTRRIPAHTYGTTRTIQLIQHGIAVFRHDTGFEGEILIGGISRAGGGKFPPHRSHRTGRDVDINLPAFPGFAKGTRARGGQVDWGATWALISAYLHTDQIKYVFLSYKLQKKLHAAAKLMGTPDDDLKYLIQWPRGPRSRHGVIRHSRGHIGHFHVRFLCGPNDRRCVDP
ncbi:MAG: penicillin-insensitive murein endopeptidase [Nannocystaceae bacterium]